MRKKIGVIGAGSWGSALAITFSKNEQVMLYVRSSKQFNTIVSGRNNPNYLPENILFNENIEVVNHLSQLILCDILILAVPVNSLRSTVKLIQQNFPKLPHLIWACKGFESSTGYLPHQVIEEELPGFKNYSALLGPSFAYEVAISMPTAICLVGHDNEYLSEIRQRLNPERNFRIYINDDLVGSEVGSAIKNVLAIGVGLSDGLGLGYNSRSALMTRSLNELSLLVSALGGKPKTIYGLTGVGDLILTCTGELSRNRKVGIELAQGKSLDQIVLELGHVAEGVKTSSVVNDIAKNLNLDMPIINMVHAVLYKNLPPQDMITNLMSRQYKLEFV